LVFFCLSQFWGSRSRFSFFSYDISLPLKQLTTTMKNYSKGLFSVLYSNLTTIYTSIGG
jgi:hypothetical protein